jgi:allantoinase
MDQNFSKKICASGHAFTVLTSQNVVLPDRVGPATLVICQATGKITSIFDSVLPRLRFPKSCVYVDYQSRIIMPGLVDTHVHLNEPGRTSSEGFFTGTQAAATGGITTVIDMPLNSIPATTSVTNLKTKLKAARGKCWVDVGFLGGIIPGNTEELRPMMKAGVRGFKGFLIDSGVSRA